MNIGRKKDKQGRVIYACSFCGKRQDQMRRLMAWPGGVFICDQCITLCNEIMTEEAALTGGQVRQREGAEGGEDGAPAHEDPLSGIRQINQGSELDHPASFVALAGDGRYVFSPEQAADFLGVHTQTIRGYIRSGKLPAYRLAGERIIRITRADLLALLQPLSPEDEV